MDVLLAHRQRSHLQARDMCILTCPTGFSPQGAESLASIWEYWDRDSQSEGEAAVVEDRLNPDHIVV